jgi:hypothetical protein
MTLPKPPSFYIKRNITITTSGVCSDVSLRCALDAMGANRVMFSVDYPFEKTAVASRFIREARVSQTERAQVASENAKQILRMIDPIGNENAHCSSHHRAQLGREISVANADYAYRNSALNP